MKRLILFVLLCIASTSFAQITITAAQFLTGFTSGQATGRSYSSEDKNGLPALIAAAGTNQNWDFGGRVYTENPTVPGAFIDVFAFPGTAPFANDPDFAASTHVIKTSVGGSDFNAIWMYVRFTDQGYWMVGNAYDSMGTPKKLIAYVPPMQVDAFPLTYQTEWHSTSRLKGPAYEQIYDSVTMQVDAKVDGWGNLVLPTRAGKPDHSPLSTTQALRIENKNTQTSSIQGFSFTTVSYSYEWRTLSQYSANISADESKAPLGVSYSTPGNSGSVGFVAENAMEIRLGANPVGSQTTVSFKLKEPSAAQVGLIDMKGNTVRMVYSGVGHTGENVIPLDVQSLTNGTYFLRVEAGSMRAIHKLVIAK